jgi:DNA-binding NarL/FixJ family response regulator
MNITAALADLTTAPELLVRIPAFLAGRLESGPVTMAVVRLVEARTEISHFAFSTANASPEIIEAARQHVLDAYRQAAARQAADPAGKGIAFEAGEIVVFREIDAQHRLVLIITHRGPEAPSANMLFTLELVGGHLITQLGAMLAWIADSSVLGSPFDRLTDREWVVLQGLQSEDGEKQLADRLELSPHTLHSHIKSIYRKLGVQGRLPVLMRLGAAQRALRMRLAAERLLPAAGAVS